MIFRKHKKTGGKVHRRFLEQSNNEKKSLTVTCLGVGDVKKKILQAFVPINDRKKINYSR